ncbi:rRNA-processing protein las1, partial [Cryomyces antarcticus]
MNGAFMVWDDLLRKLVRHQRRFLRIFVTRMVHLMIQQSRMNVKQDPFREALCLWALHIFVDESWADARKRIEDSLRTKVVSICMMNPVYWGQRLARLLIEAADETFQYDWIPLYNECLPQSASSSQQDSVAPVTRGSATQRGLKRLDEVMFTPMKRPV